MITKEQYFQGKPHSAAQEAAAERLLARADSLADEFHDTTLEPRQLCPNTGTEISGSKSGSGDGGFRLDTASTGSSHSSHKILYVQLPDGSWQKDPTRARAAVDRFDPGDLLDRWLDQFEDGQGGNSKLEEYGLYREAPEDTPGWCHLTDRAPHSNKRTFKP
jgi:hypothetical protein